ncbi:putative receptor-type tyrosine-protein phosphatase mosPTP-1 [Diadema antillarum]|uniref:putative receptor-type tyrosine-protein phosphatase mosPTP-1 n=1 Tax=Diadema antillarum TaxID=105358 RepID=UPI003A85C72E
MSCQAGFGGNRCETVCYGGTFGANCELNCNCASGVTCNSATGCQGDCAAGYWGDLCQASGACNEGYFGTLCNYPCHCKTSSTCDQISGQCPNDDSCADGWAGSDCQQALPRLVDSPWILDVTSDSVLIAWNAWKDGYDYGTGPVHSYLITYSWTDDVGNTGNSDEPVVISGDSTANITGLYGYRDYEFLLSVRREVDGIPTGGISSSPIRVKTQCDAPLYAPSAMTVNITGAVSIEVTWQLPNQPGSEWLRCNSSSFSYNLTYWPSEYPADFRVMGFEGDYSITHLATDLSPCTEYIFSVVIINSIDLPGPEGKINGTTDVIAPDPVDDLTATSESYDNVKILWAEPATKCFPLAYQVTRTLLLRDQCDDTESDNSKVSLQQMRPSTPMTTCMHIQHTTLLSSHIMWNVTTTWPYRHRGRCFIQMNQLRDDDPPTFPEDIFTASTTLTYRSLSDYTSYNFTVCAYTSAGAGPCDSIQARTLPSASVGLIAGLGVGIPLLLIVLVVGIVFRRRQRSAFSPQSDIMLVSKSSKVKSFSLSDAPDLSVEGSPYQEVVTPPKEADAIIHGPILERNLANYVKQNLESPDGFEKEFKDLYSEAHSNSTAFLPRNKMKNRYNNIVTFEEHRVKLHSKSTEPGADYINATFIDGYRKDEAYIATQAPNNASVNDFWQMIYEQNVATVVMLTNLVEDDKVRCFQYWPESNDRQQYGNFVVTCDLEQTQASFIHRRLELRPRDSEEARRVSQYHFTIWPEKGEPESSQPLIDFRNVVRNEHPADASPLVVHCRQQLRYLNI